MATATRRARDTIVGKVRAADPFELIRWLARSQPDPRKALAELVQNSIDAGARRIQITRLRERGVTALHIADDGEGVIPELERTEALTHIATHIGHSRKQNLTPEQRRELMVQGKYGIGLLGFWSIGQTLEMRSQVAAPPAYLLRMFEDSPRFEIERFRSRLPFGDRYTEIVVRGLHRPAWSSLTARRMADYLAVELRGQILAREVDIIVHDRIARGRAQKVLEVKPARFSGERLDLPELLPTLGFSAIRVELYLLPSSSSNDGQVSISAAGTVVYDDVQAFEVADFHRMPWTEPRLTGLLEFPDFQVPPGSRRGVVPDQAALAFATTLRELEPLIDAHLRAAQARAASEVEADLLRQLERAFRDVPRLAPEYDFFAVRAAGTAPFANPSGQSSANGDAGSASAASPPAAELVDGMPISTSTPEGEEAEVEPTTLFEAGALASLAIVPANTRVERLGERRLRSEAYDASGTRIRRQLDTRWSVMPELGRLEPNEGARTSFRAGPEVGLVTIAAEANEEGRTARAEAVVKIVDLIPGTDSPRSGIPEPLFVDDRSSAWRSRLSGERWEVNSGHPDFQTAAQSSKRKLRYLATLLAKEIVLHSFPQPQLGPALERLVEVMTITERRLERG